MLFINILIAEVRCINVRIIRFIKFSVEILYACNNTFLKMRMIGSYVDENSNFPLYHAVFT